MKYKKTVVYFTSCFASLIIGGLIATRKCRDRYDRKSVANNIVNNMLTEALANANQEISDVKSAIDILSGTYKLKAINPYLYDEYHSEFDLGAHINTWKGDAKNEY